MFVILSLLNVKLKSIIFFQYEGRPTTSRVWSGLLWHDIVSWWRVYVICYHLSVVMVRWYCLTTIDTKKSLYESGNVEGLLKLILNSCSLSATNDFLLSLKRWEYFLLSLKSNFKTLKTSNLNWKQLLKSVCRLSYANSVNLQGTRRYVSFVLTAMKTRLLVVTATISMLS